MADDRSKRGPQDRSRINLSEDYEVRYWSKKFRVTPDLLRAAVEKVGNTVRRRRERVESGVAVRENDLRRRVARSRDACRTAANRQARPHRVV